MSSNAMRWKVTLKMSLIGYKFSGKRNILSSGRKLLKLIYNNLLKKFEFNYRKEKLYHSCFAEIKC